MKMVNDVNDELCSNQTVNGELILETFFFHSYCSPALCIYSMGPKKVLIFRNTLPCNGNFAFHVRFCSVLQFSVFLLLCQHFKSAAQRTVKER